MEIINHQIKCVLYSPVVNINIVNYTSFYIVYLFTLENNSKYYYKEFLNDILDKYIFFEIMNNSLLWKIDFKCHHNNNLNNYKLDVIVKLQIEMIEEYKNKSIAFNYFLLIKNNNLPFFNKFNENKNYLPNNELLNPSGNFQIELYDYQKKSLSKMIEIENQTKEYTINYSSQIDLENHKFIIDPIKGIISNNIRSFKLNTNGGILADEMGLGKTITSLSLIATNCSQYNEILKMSKFDNIGKKIYTKATLIICPSHLTKQWESETKKCIKNVKILVINTKKDHEKLNFDAFISNDIIITSHQFLMNFKYYPTLYYGHITPRYYNSTLRIKKINEELNKLIEDIENIKIKECPIFEFFYFHRLILDEGHEIFGEMLGNSSLSRYMANWLSSIDSDNYWFLSGSPFVNITGVENAFKFINLNLTDTIDNLNIKYRKLNKYDNLEVLTEKLIIQNDIIKKNYIIENILENICIRHKKSDIENLDILGYDEEIIWVEFTELERNIYNSKVNKIDVSGLLKLCCHPLVLESSKKIFGDIELDLDVMKYKLIEHHKNNVNVYNKKLEELTNSNPSYHMVKKNYENVISESTYLLNVLEKLDNIILKEESCAICFQDESLSLTKCGHIYCKECILKWISQKKNCPICKKNLLISDIYLIKKEKMEIEIENNINSLINKYGSKLGKIILMIKSILIEDSAKIIIFSQWDPMLALIGKSLIENNINYNTVKGNVWCRTSAINEFKNGKNSQIILLSLKNGASGTNLTEATHIFFIEPLNEIKEIRKAIESQAIARACRIGQQHKIKLFRLLVKDSIEEEIYNNNYI